MDIGKPPKPGLSIAYSIRRKNAQKMAKGGYPVAKDPNYADGGEVSEPMIVCGPSSIASAIRAKKMAAGGEVNDDFLSDEEDTALPDETEEPEEPESRKSRLLSKVFENMRKRR